jgi:hypothetical protein
MAHPLSERDDRSRFSATPRLFSLNAWNAPFPDAQPAGRPSEPRSIPSQAGSRWAGDVRSSPGEPAGAAACPRCAAA